MMQFPPPVTVSMTTGAQPAERPGERAGPIHVRPWDRAPGQQEGAGWGGGRGGALLVTRGGP